MIIITGGAGFIGSVLAAELEERGMGPLLIVDRLRCGAKWRNIAKRRLYDLVTPTALKSALEAYAERIEAIYHLGAISDTTWTDADAIVENNIRLSFDLWDWCAAHGVPFIYASSASTYGNGENGFNDDEGADALAALRPLNLYGWSKHLVDRKFTELARAGAPTPPHWAGFKLFNVYGPNEYHKGEMRSVVVKLFEQIENGEPARLFKSDQPAISDGEQMRDFIWVEDAVDAMIWMLNGPGRSGLYNLGSGKARSFADLARAVFSAFERPVSIKYVGMPAALKGRYQYFTEARMDRLRAAGWKHNATSLEDGVRSYVTQYMLSSDRYR